MLRFLAKTRLAYETEDPIENVAGELSRRGGRYVGLFWDVLSLLVLLGTMAGHVVYVLNDNRVPRDAGLYYNRLPDAFAWLAKPGADLTEGLSLLGNSTGWYNLLLGIGLRGFGRSPEVFRAFDVAWVAVILWGAWWLARRISTPAGGFAAISLVASMPMVVLSGRTGWIHIPEAALAMTLLVAWSRDLDLDRRATVLWMAVLGGLAITLRPSGAVWVACVVPAMGWRSVQSGRWRNTALVWLSWGVALGVPFRALPRYVGAKLGARSRYVKHLGDIDQQFIWVFGGGVILLVGIGLVLLLASRKQRLPLVVIPLILWPILAVVLWILFRSGLDNFPLMGVALAVLAGCGVGRTWPLWALLPGIFWLIFSLPQWLSLSTVRGHRVLQVATPLGANTNLLNHYRTWEGFGGEDVQGLLAATCPPFKSRETCRILVNQGLFQPFGEEPGALELFLLKQDTVELFDVRNLPPRIETFHLHGAVQFTDCGRRERHWEERFPGAATAFALVGTGMDMVPVWTRLLDKECTVSWKVPQGRLAFSDKLPTTGVRKLRGDREVVHRSEQEDKESTARPRVRPSDIRKGRLPAGSTPRPGAGEVPP